jgi:hypothetical protein
MNIKPNYFLALTLLLLTGIVHSSAQVEEDMNGDVEIEEVPELVSEINYTKGNTFGDDYLTQYFFDDYKLIYHKSEQNSYRKTFGVIKGNKMVLPVLFNSVSRSGKEEKVIVSLGNYYGIYHLETGKWIIPLQYNLLVSLGNGYYRALKNQLSGVIDEQQNVIIPFEYTSISNLYNLENYFIVSSNDGGLNEKGVYNIVAGKFTIEPGYANITWLTNQNLFQVQNYANQFNLADVRGNLLFKEWYEQIIVDRGGRPRYIIKKNGLMGIIDNNEEPITPLSYKMISNSPYSDGSYLAQNYEGLFGCITIDGEVTLPFKFDNFKMQGYAGVGISSANSKCGLVKVNSGKPFELATCDFDDIQFQQTAFIVKANEKYGIIDLLGKSTVETKYDAITSVGRNTFIVKDGKKVQLLNQFGIPLSEQFYAELSPVLNNSKRGYSRQETIYLKALGKNNKYGIIDMLGTEILTPQFEDIEQISNNLIVVMQDGKKGIYSLMKKQLWVECKFDNIVFKESELIAFSGNSIYKRGLNPTDKLVKVF